jgi:uncharacterized metal-binding protein
MKVLLKLILSAVSSLCSDTVEVWYGRKKKRKRKEGRKKERTDKDEKFSIKMPPRASK